MELKTFDLYNSGYIEEFSDGSKYLERDEVDYDGNDTDRIHTVKQNDTITRIAYVYYKDLVKNPQQHWWKIADANTEILNPMDLSDLIGYDIVIPDPVLFELNQ